MSFIPWKTGREAIVPTDPYTDEEVAKMLANVFNPLSDPAHAAGEAAKLMGTEGGPSAVAAKQSAGMDAGPSPFNLADAFGTQLVGGGGIKLLSQALSELFGKKKKQENPKTYADYYADAKAATPTRTSYLDETLKGK